MTYDPQCHRRRSIRLRGYDYAQPGAYFVTLVTRDRACVFGEVVDGQMRLNACGATVRACWEDIPTHFPRVQLDAFVIMPNHIHGVLRILDQPSPMEPVGARHAVPLPHAVPPPDAATPRATGLAGDAGPRAERFGRPVAGSLPTIVRSFKSATTRRINGLRDVPGAAVQCKWPWLRPCAPPGSLIHLG